jgi:hypothetical protein
MSKNIVIRVEFHGQERLLFVVSDEGQWHAALEECVNPSPPGTRLPVMELREFNLRIEQPEGNVVGMEMGKLLAARGVSIEDGWIVGVKLASVRGDMHDDIGLPDRQRSPGEWGKVLDLHALQSRHEKAKAPAAEKCKDRDIER